MNNNRTFSDSLLKNIATLGFVGYMPVAPGTWGSAVGVLVVLLLNMSLPFKVLAQVLVICFVTAVGVAASTVAERVIGRKDSGHIIIDELAGYLVSVFSLPHTYTVLIAAFFLFRFFDILKPFPIRFAERNLRAGWGIMMDDVLAGVYTNLIIQGYFLIYGH